MLPIPIVKRVAGDAQVDPRVDRFLDSTGDLGAVRGRAFASTRGARDMKFSDPEMIGPDYPLSVLEVE